MTTADLIFAHADDETAAALRAELQRLAAARDTIPAVEARRDEQLSALEAALAAAGERTAAALGDASSLRAFPADEERLASLLNGGDALASEKERRERAVRQVEIEQRLAKLRGDEALLRAEIARVRVGAQTAEREARETMREAREAILRLVQGPLLDAWDDVMRDLIAYQLAPMHAIKQTLHHTLFNAAIEHTSLFTSDRRELHFNHPGAPLVLAGPQVDRYAASAPTLEDVRPLLNRDNATMLDDLLAELSHVAAVITEASAVSTAGGGQGR